MGFGKVLKKPFDKLKSGSSSSGSSTAAGEMEPEGRLENGNKHSTGTQHRKSQEAKQQKDEERQRIKTDTKHREEMVKKNELDFLHNGPEELTSLYKPISMNMSKSWPREARFMLRDLDTESMVGKTVTFRARIHTLRPMSAKLAFIVFRQQTITIQGVLQVSSDTAEADSSLQISEQMVRTVEHYDIESIVLVTGEIRRPPAQVKNATIHDAEIAVMKVHLISGTSENVPFTVYNAENVGREDKEGEDSSEEDEESYARDVNVDGKPSISDDKPAKRSDNTDDRGKRVIPQPFRLHNRIIDLRTASSQSIFRIQSGICNIFRSYLDNQGFIEIHTPKLQGGATESGSTVFEVKYFGRKAFLAQSPQLANQMCIASDFERVYEIGPVFRAEDSNTPRHMTEYTGLDLEMAIEEHYHEALDVIDGMFKNLWKSIYDRYGKELETINKYYPHEKVLWLEETPRIPFSKGIQMLIESGWKDEDGNPPSENEDLATRAEIRLGELVREQYKTDYYILDKFPASARPFYTMPDPKNDKFTNSFDIFMRGQEITTGGQRIHSPEFLEQRMRKSGVRPDTMEEYMDGFYWGAPPHAGAGIGLERLLYLFLGLGNIRLASLFPRDPKSLPERPCAQILRHPEASTNPPPWERKDRKFDEEEEKKKPELQSLEQLIANYGDAPNTAWLDERYEIWRHEETGAAQGYVPSKGRAIVVGDPLCDKSQYPRVISAFLRYLKEEKKSLKPLWLIASKQTAEYLGTKCNWRSVSAIAEERVDAKNNPALKDRDLQRKVRHAESSNVKNINVASDEPLSEELKKRIDARIKDWHDNRHGKQAHLTEIRPWVDEEHRRYFYACDGSKEGKIHGLMVLHQLSAENGYQIKFSLEFPDAPSGTIESLTLHAISEISAQDPDVSTLTFGTGAMRELVKGENLKDYRFKILQNSYATIVQSLKLINKSEFRAKLGAKDERDFICYPKGAMGASGIRAILAFIEDDAGDDTT